MIVDTKPPGAERDTTMSDATEKPRRHLGLSAAGLGVVVIAAFMAGGCASQSMVEIPDPAGFQKVVLEADHPVLVEFFKGG